MTHAGMERLLSTTMLLGLASLALVFAWSSILGGIPVLEKARKTPGDKAGMLVFAAILAFMSGMMTVTMRYSNDPAERRAPFVVFGLLAAGAGLGGVRRWAAGHGNAAVRDAVDSVFHRTAAWGTLTCLVVVMGMMIVWLRTELAGLAGFLATVLPLLGWAAGGYLARFGWNAAWFRPFVTLFITRGPSRPARVAAADGWREYRAFTPRARVALTEAWAGPFLAALATVFLGFVPLAPLMKPAMAGGLAAAGLHFGFGVIGGGVFVVFLPAFLLMGFAFAFILMPLALLRAAGGVSGGAGATGEL